MLTVIETYFPFPVAWQIVIFSLGCFAPAPGEPVTPRASVARTMTAMRLVRRMRRWTDWASGPQRTTETGRTASRDRGMSDDSPGRWIREVGLGGDRDESRVRATQNQTFASTPGPPRTKFPRGWPSPAVVGSTRGRNRRRGQAASRGFRRTHPRPVGEDGGAGGRPERDRAVEGVVEPREALADGEGPAQASGYRGGPDSDPPPERPSPRRRVERRRCDSSRSMTSRRPDDAQTSPRASLGIQPCASVRPDGEVDPHPSRSRRHLPLVEIRTRFDSPSGVAGRTTVIDRSRGVSEPAPRGGRAQAGTPIGSRDAAAAPSAAPATGVPPGRATRAATIAVAASTRFTP